MPDQFHEDVESVRPLVQRCLDDIESLRDLFERDRWWRRLGKVMVILAFLTSGLYWAYDQQQRCLRGNQTRLDVRDGIHVALEDALRSGGASQDEMQARLDRNDVAVERAIPLRDC